MAPGGQSVLFFLFLQSIIAILCIDYDSASTRGRRLMVLFLFLFGWGRGVQGAHGSWRSVGALISYSLSHLQLFYA